MRKPGATLFGFVRFNLRGVYAVYVNQPYADPERRFVATREGREGKCFVNPDDGDSVRYAVSALESAWDGR